MRTIKNTLLVACCMLVAGCGSSPGGSPNSPSIGPRIVGTTNQAEREQLPEAGQFVGYSVSIPPFDPGIPEDSNKFEELGIWPELRRTEAIRFATELSEHLEVSPSVAVARVTPSSEATSHFYVIGKIDKSNGEDFAVEIELIDITGKSHFKKVYRERVGDYQDPRLTSRNKYTPFLQEIAEDIDRRLKRVRERDRVEIVGVEEMRFAMSFQPEYFSQFLEFKRRNRVRLAALPSANDSAFQRIQTIRIKDQLFIDNIQRDYQKFKSDSDDPYYQWQEQAYIESKAAREARNKARTQLFRGILVAAVGVAAIAADTNPYGGTGTYAGVAAVVGGAALAIRSSGAFADAKAHVGSLNEIGQSVNIGLAPKVMEIEGKQVELVGSAEEQYSSWRGYLNDFYVLEETPDIEL